MKKNNIPTRIYLTEDQIPTTWYNLRADMKEKPAPLLNPGTKKPVTVSELSNVFCEKLAEQELDNDTRYFEIPKEVRDFYKMYRPSPLVRAYNLEKALGTPARIYFKYEGNNTSGSHKLNSAAAQVYYVFVNLKLVQGTQKSNRKMVHSLNEISRMRYTHSGGKKECLI